MRGDPGISGSPLFVVCSGLLLLPAVPVRRYGIFFCQLFHLAAFTRCSGRLFRQICNRSIYLTIAVLSYRFSIGLTALSPIIVVSPEDFYWTNRTFAHYRS